MQSHDIESLLHKKKEVNYWKQLKLFVLFIFYIFLICGFSYLLTQVPTLFETV